MNSHIRAFESSDAREIVDLHRKFNHWFEESKLSVEYVIQCSLRHDFRFFVAEDNNQVVGFCGVLFYESVGRAELGPVCIMDEFQGRGVGSQLVEKTIDFLKQKGIHRIVVKVKAGTQAALKFFTQKFFTQEAQLKPYTKKGEDAVQMVKLL